MSSWIVTRQSGGFFFRGILALMDVLQSILSSFTLKYLLILSCCLECYPRGKYIRKGLVHMANELYSKRLYMWQR